MKYFGTDGIRGIVGEKINASLLKKIAKGIVCYYKKYKLKPVLLVGNDSRESSYYILSILESYLLPCGIQVEDIGVCSSPCLAFLTKKYVYPLGMMISASHNPNNYNGIKFFNANGEKVGDQFELEFEKFMDKKHFQITYQFATHKNMEKLKNDYINELKKYVRFSFPCIFDCANGGTSEICKQLFPKQTKINFKPNGKNINLNAGSTHVEYLSALCVKEQKIGFAFDGDGDRIIVVDKTGEILDGDKILYLLSKFYLNKKDVLVGTIYTNSALENCLKKKNEQLVRSKVGDKNIYNSMKEYNSILGGENNGHIILKTYFNTGDGVFVAILIANLLSLTGRSLKYLLNDYFEYSQITENIKFEKTFIMPKEIKNFIDKNSNKDTRIIVRKSGTESILRLFVENKNNKNALKIMKKLKNLIKNVQF